MEKFSFVDEEYSRNLWKLSPDPQIHMILQYVQNTKFLCVKTYCFTNDFVLCDVDAGEI